MGGRTSILIESSLGDPLGGGRTFLFLPQSEEVYAGIGDQNNDGIIDAVRVDYTERHQEGVYTHSWSLYFSTGEVGANLVPGTYTGALLGRLASAGHPGMEISGDNSASSQIFGSFTVNDFAVDYSGSTPVLLSLSISFEQHSQSLANPALFGTVNYNYAGATPATIESSGATGLQASTNRFFLLDGRGEGLGLSYQGSAVAGGQFGAWTPIGAEKSGNGYQVAWKFGNADQYTLWSTDANGNYLSNLTGIVAASDPALQSAEILFQQDLNGDARIGLPLAAAIETNGVTKLTTAGGLYYLQDNLGAGPALKYLGTFFSPGQFGAWTPIGAEKNGSGYEIAWKFGDADQYTLWNTDANGNYLFNVTGVVPASDFALQSAEILFQQDLNGDSRIGLPPAVPIESNGTTKLTTAAGLYFLQDNLGAGPTLKYQGADFVAGQFGAWIPIGAEKNGSGYEIAWKFGNTNQYTLWNTDANGNYLASLLGVVPDSNPALQVAETRFRQDLNGDAFLGSRQVLVETAGDTALAQAGNQFYLEDATGTGPVVKYLGNNFSAGQLGGWRPIAAEKTGSGYEIAWRNGTFDQFTLWSTDANGNFLTALVGAVPGSNPTLQAAETLFQQDLNRDGYVGIHQAVVENLGATTLITNADLFYFQDYNGAGPVLKYHGSNFLTGQFGDWTPIGAEKAGAGYEVAWRNGTADQYTLWATDAKGNYLGSLAGAVPGSDSTLQAAENLFRQDLNGNGLIGGATATNIHVTVSDPGNLFPGQVGQILNDTVAAFAMWQPYLAPAAGSFDVKVTITTATAALADSTFTNFTAVGVVSGVTVYMAGAASSLLTGIDSNGSASDIEIRINPTYLAQNIWIDPLNGSSLPFSKLDLVDILAHELAHGLGINGWQDSSTGILPSNYESTFDQYVTFTNGRPYFTGPHAEAVFGGPVPLAAGNLFHTSGVGNDVMNPAPLYGTRIPISLLDVAILSDCGLATILSDRLVGGSTDDIMNGGLGSDTILGGSGDDNLTGGLGQDVFMFTSLNDLSPNGDHVTDFDAGDAIDLSSIAGLHFIGTASFSRSAGETRYAFEGGTTTILIDANGDAIADGRIILENNALGVTETSPGSNVLVTVASISIEANGQTVLATAANQFFLNDSGGTGPVLSFQGSPVIAGQFGAWAPIGAEKMGNGYEIAWKFGLADQYTLWNTDANGNYTGNLIGVVPGSDPSLEAAETLFQQDLNGDGHFGLF